MSKKTTLERSYFHIENGGFTLSIVERVDKIKDRVNLPDDWFKGIESGKYLLPTHENGVELPPRHADGTPFPVVVNHNRSWYFEVAQNHFGTETRYRFPLVPLMVRWAISALQRVLARMEEPQSEPTDGIEFAFQEMEYCSVMTKNGKPVNERMYPPSPTEEVAE